MVSFGKYLLNGIRFTKNSLFKSGSLICLFAVLFASILTFSGCKEPKIKDVINSNVFIADYIHDSLSNCSLYSEILTITKYKGFLNAYGTYTCFVPTDAAVKKFIEEQKGSSATLADFNTKEDTLLLKRIVKYMTVSDTVATSEFTDGKFPYPSMYGQYFTSSSSSTGSGVAYILNGSVNVIQSNIRLSNGLIHTVDKVMIPEMLTISQKISSMSGYSIFIDAMKATGWYDSLNYDCLETNNERYMTLLAESDETYKQYGISTFDDLKARMNYIPYTDPDDSLAYLKDSLYLYVSYHILGSTNRYYKYSTDTQYVIENAPYFYYLNDIVSQSSIGTFVDGVSMNVRVVNNTIRVGERIAEDGITYYNGVTLNKEMSDIGASNGVIHTLSANENSRFVFFPRTPDLLPIYWEPTEQTELIAEKSIFRKPGKASSYGSFNLQMGAYANMSWVGGTRYTDNYVQYVTMGSPLDVDDIYYNYDCLGVFVKDSYVDKFTIKTPKLQKARYKVWICTTLFRSYDNYCNISYKKWSDEDNDDEVDRRTDTAYRAFSRQLYTSTNYGGLVPASNNASHYLTSDYIESLGYKFYMIKSDTSPERGGANNGGCFDTYGMYVGVMDVKEAGYYRLKFTPSTTPTIRGGINGAAIVNGFFRLDMIHFIPEDLDQVWPKFIRGNSDHDRIYKPTADQYAKNKLRYPTQVDPSRMSTSGTKRYEY
jgi:uncharacterized surface protein with fasciclin (FAS1) repeats